jgi:dihydroorotase-like cyclic amidohydrolase
MDLILRNGTVITDGIEAPLDVAVRDGRVRAVGELGEMAATTEVDCTGRILMPGAVDLGLNLLDDGEIDPESGAGFALATREAALGGVTTIVATMEIDGADEVGTVLEAQRDADSHKAWVDFGYHLLLADWKPGRAAQLREATAAGIPSAWLARAVAGARLSTAGMLRSVLAAAPDDFLLLVDPWDAGLCESGLRAVREGAPWGEALTEEAEAALVAYLGRVAGLGGARVLLRGISTAAAIEELAALREQNPRLSGGALAGHLLLAEAEGERPPRLWPPLRQRSQQNALYAAIEEGLVSVVLSGHKPRTALEVVADSTGPKPAPVGFATLSAMLPALYGEAGVKWRLSLAALSQALCADPAKLAGCYPRKGSLQPGSDADIVIIDPQGTTTRTDAAEAPAHEYHDPFAGATFHGRIERVFLRGRQIVGPKGLSDSPSGLFVFRRVALR